MTLPQILSFGPFEFDRQSGELRKHGMRVRLADQPRAVLELLLDHHGEIVTREEIRQRLWAADTFVDFDAGLSSVVRKLRDALGEAADHPRYIETVPRRGYRFIATTATRTGERRGISHRGGLLRAGDAEGADLRPDAPGGI